jgi:hypothetical protein
MRAADLPGLITMLGAGLIAAVASCAHPAQMPPVDPAVRNSMLDCAAQRASGYGFVIYKSQDIPADELEMVRARYVTGNAASVDVFVITVVRADSASPPRVHIHAYAAVGWEGAGTQELTPGPEVVALADSISARCPSGGPSRSRRFQRVP